MTTQSQTFHSQTHMISIWHHNSFLILYSRPKLKSIGLDIDLCRSLTMFECRLRLNSDVCPSVPAPCWTGEHLRVSPSPVSGSDWTLPPLVTTEATPTSGTGQAGLMCSTTVISRHWLMTLIMIILTLETLLQLT